MELYADWKAALQPSLQTAHEFQGSVRDFIDSVGDIAAEEIVNDDLFSYRDEASTLVRLSCSTCS